STTFCNAGRFSAVVCNSFDRRVMYSSIEAESVTIVLSSKALQAAIAGSIGNDGRSSAAGSESTPVDMKFSLKENFVVVFLIKKEANKDVNSHCNGIATH